MNSKFVFLAMASLTGLVSCSDEARADTRMKSEFGDVVIQGEGCADRLKVQASTGKPLSIAFSDEPLSVGYGSSADNAARAQIRCRVAIPINVPEGMRVRTQPGTWIGKSYFSQGSSATASVIARLFFDGETESMSATATLLPKASVPPAPTDEPWTLVLGGLASEAPCGQAVRLSAQLTLVLRQGTASPDEAQLQPGTLELPELIYKRCPLTQ